MNGWMLLQGGAYAEVLPTLASFGWQGCRVDTGTTWGETQDVLDAGMRPLVTIRGPQDIAALPDHPLDLDLWNEPDSGCGPEWPKLTPQQYASLAVSTHEQIRRLGRRDQLWIAPISNLSEQALDWLYDMLAWGIPADCGLCPHRYPHGFGMPFETPHPGFACREAEVAALWAIIGSRRWGIGEVGYHQARETTGALCWKKSSRLGDEEVRQRMQQEFAFWRAQGAEFCVWYQFRDGPTDTRLDRYGIRRTDGTWKPQARVIP